MLAPKPLDFNAVVAETNRELFIAKLMTHCEGLGLSVNLAVLCLVQLLLLRSQWLGRVRSRTIRGLTAERADGSGDACMNDT